MYGFTDECTKKVKAFSEKEALSIASHLVDNHMFMMCRAELV